MAFYVRLKKFFQKHDPDRLYMVKKIVRNFAAQEDDVMARLEEIYSSGGPSKLVSTNKKSNSFIDSFSSESNVDSNARSNDIDNVSNQDIESDLTSNKKSKKKIILISIIAVVLIVGGYFGYTMFFSSDNHEDTHVEESTHQEHADDDAHDSNSDSDHQPQVKSEETHQEVVEQPVVLDSVKANDSTSVDSDSLSNVEQEVIESVEVINALGH